MTDHPFPPGPTNTRAALLRLSRDPINFFLDMLQSYGEYAHVQVGNRAMYVVSDPALLQHIFIQDMDKYDKDDHTKLTFGPLGENLFVLAGAEHRQHRRTLQPLFTMTRVAEYADTVLAYTQDMLNNWQAGQTYALDKVLYELTMGIVSEAIFGIRSESVRAEFAEAMAIFQQHTAETRYRSHFTDEHMAAYHGALATFDRIVDSLLAQMQPNGHDFLSLMANAKDPETGLGLSRQEIHDEALTLLVAGHATTANALLWTWYLLGKHPVVEARVAAEIQQVTDGHTVMLSDLSKLELLNQVFKESLRLYPPAWLMGRQATEPLKLGDYTIFPGATVAVSPYAMHRNPKYFPEPEAFKPERFAVELPKYTYIPFGLGSHICIGQHFATMEALLILANVIQRFQLSVPAEYEAVPEGLVTLQPKEKIMVTLTDRLTTHA